MSTPPNTTVLDRKSTNRIFTGPQPCSGANTFGVDAAEFLGLNRYRYFRAASAITAGQWVSLNAAGGDFRTVLPASQAATINFCIGVAVDGATAGEATAGKLVKIQVAGFHPAAAVSTGGGPGWWVVLGAVPGTCARFDPADIITGVTEPEVEIGLRTVGDRVGILMEAAAGGLGSVWINPRL